MAVFVKDRSYAHFYPERIIRSMKEFDSGMIEESNEILNFQEMTADQKIILKQQGPRSLRARDDNHPYPNYLETLLIGFQEQVDIVYGRVAFVEEAVNQHIFRSEKSSFLIPGDLGGVLRKTNIDCMCYMVRMVLAKEHLAGWTDSCEADWCFLDRLLKNEGKAFFVDRIVGEKR